MEPQQPKPAITLDYVEPENGRMITYANNVMWGVTSYDVRLIFGEVIEINDSKATVEQRVQVTMSWLQAKQLTELLDEKVKAYEAKNGRIDTKMLPS